MINKATTPKTNDKNYSAYSIIQKKRDGKKLSSNEIAWFIKNLTSNKIPDYQTSALLMAIYINGFDNEETTALTDAMLYSGDVLNFNDQRVIDKHSTGGVGDKTSFILAPLAAACGVKVPMIAGRGLGHTGGTVDKIESIKGFNTTLNLKQFSQQLIADDLVLIGQTDKMAPADKKIYALRDVTATIESIPLITASIMSKKLAEGTSGIVMDIKYGSGAFMKTKLQARALAKSLRDTSLRFKKNIITTITDMSQPLGNLIGNSLEIIESIETLKNKGPKDLTNLSCHLAGGMVHLAGISKDLKSGVLMAQKALISGEGLKKFVELIVNQGGDPKIVEDYSRLPLASEQTIIYSSQNGYLKSIDGKQIGLFCVDLGGGRKSAKDQVDFSVGFSLHKKVGDKVKVDTPLITIHHHKHQQHIVEKIIDEIHKKEIFKISKSRPSARPLILETQISWSK